MNCLKILKSHIYIYIIINQLICILFVFREKLTCILSTDVNITLNKFTLRISGVMGFGPLDDNEPTKGASVLLPSVLLYIVAVAFLLKKKIIRT